MLVFSSIFLSIGIFCWIMGGKVDRITFFFMYPRCAIPVGFMFVLWGISFILCGAVFYGVLFGCERFRRSKMYKSALLIVLMQIFTYITYPLFFRAAAPFIAFLAFLIAEIFCFFAIRDCLKNYSLWSIILIVHFLWLIYNGYCALAFSIIN